MGTFLLIGPSGSGKSTAAKIICERRLDTISVADLDKELKRGIGGNSISEYLRNEGDRNFFEFSKRMIEEIYENGARNTLIIVGAGSVNYSPAHEWYLKQDLISLIGDPKVIYERGDRKQYHPTIEGFIQTEFSESRKYLYENAKYKIDVTKMSPDEVASKILEKIVR